MVFLFAITNKSKELMLKHYLTLSFRHFKKHKFYFALNILGFSIGLSCFVALALFAYSEFSYDKFFSDPDRLYRVTTYVKRGDQEIKWAITSGGMVDILRDKVPGVQDATKALLSQSDDVFTTEKNSFIAPERTGFFVDSNFLTLFDFLLLSGTDSTVLRDPNSIVLTKSSALKYFGTIDVLGETITMESSDDEDLVLKVTGVLQDVPENSHIQFSYLISGNSLPDWANFSDPQRGGFMVFVYFKTESPMADSVLDVSIQTATKDVYGEQMKFPVQKITNIHFDAKNLFEHTQEGNYKFVLMLIYVGIFVLIIAIINHVILSTAQSLKRLKEIGVRKTVGSTSWKLISQMLIESILISTIAGLCSIVVIELTLKFVFPFWFDIKFTLFDNYYSIPLVLIFSGLVGLIAGVYPGYKISRFDAAGIFLKGNPSRKQWINIRAGLVSLQFIFAFVITVGSYIVLRQLNFLQNKDLGFEKELVVNISKPYAVKTPAWDFFKKNVADESSVVSSSATLYKFISDYNASSIKVIDDEKQDTLSLRVQWNTIDPNLIPTLGMTLTEGRNFSAEIASDSFGIIINEAAKKKLGLVTAVEKKVLSWFFKKAPGKIIGVVKDFHFQSFDKEVAPIIFILHQKNFGENHLLVKLRKGDIETSLDRMNAAWSKSGTEAPFEYAFLDQSFNKLISKEAKLSSLVQALSISSMIVSMLGVIGLVMLILEQKKVEIGIRKVFGASTRSLLLKMNFYFLPSILIAFSVAVPISIWGINKWLTNFAYRIEINFVDFAIVGFLFAGIAFLTISAQSWKSAKTKPVTALKNE